MLDSEVLVLNRVYLPVQVTTARRAFCLLYQGKAQAILADYTTYDFDRWSTLPTEEFGACIGLLTGSLAVPRVIVLRQYGGLPRREVRFSRRNVFVRDGYQCQYCGRIGTPKELNLDHVKPLARGGKSTWDNVVCCCIPCNRRKGDRLPAAAGLRLLREPKRPRWHPIQTAGHRTSYPTEWRNFVDPAILDWQPRQAAPAAGVGD